MISKGIFSENTYNESIFLAKNSDLAKRFDDTIKYLR